LEGGFVRVCGGARVRAGIKLASGFTYNARVERIFCQLLNKISKQKLIVTVIKDFNHHTFQVFCFIFSKLNLPKVVPLKTAKTKMAANQNKTP